MKTRLSEFSIALLAWLALAAPAAQARLVPQLSELLRAQLQRVPGAIDACSLAEGEDDENWEIDKFFLDISPYVAVGISNVLQVQVTPEIVFIWSRGDSGD